MQTTNGVLHNKSITTKKETKSRAFTHCLERKNSSSRHPSKIVSTH
uniref:Uncharacterized protein n=1 Tax=Arundo donax TaxID=35708 RepID=A0A0A9AFR8_ARUDO